MNLVATLTGLAPDALTPEVQRALLTTWLFGLALGTVVTGRSAVAAFRAYERSWAATRARLGTKPPVSQGVGPSRKARA